MEALRSAVRKEVLMHVLKVALALAVVFGLSGVASAQSLGELAEQQKQKRQGKPVPKTITDADLGKTSKSKGTLSITGAPEPPAEGQGDATAAEPAAEAAPEAEVTAEAGAEGTPPPAEQRAVEPAKPKGPPPKTDDQIRAEKRAEMQKKLDLLRKELAKHTQMRDQVQSNLNGTLGMYTDGRAEMIQLLETEKQKVAQAESEIAQLEEDIRRSNWP
jgi:hypothetical protein